MPEQILFQNLVGYRNLCHVSDYSVGAEYLKLPQMNNFSRYFTVCILIIFCDCKLESKEFLSKHSKRWQNKYSFLPNCTCFCKTGKMWIAAYHSPSSLVFLLFQLVLQNHPLQTWMASVKMYKYLFHGYSCCYYK